MADHQGHSIAVQHYKFQLGNLQLGSSNRLTMNRPILTWTNLEYSVNNLLSNSSKTILNRVNGFIEPKSLTALMGASGSGKSTLMKCLSGVDRHGMSGTSHILFDCDIDLNICFIFQDQNRYLHKSLTVKQSLTYASKLKNSGHPDFVDHNANVNEILEQFLLNDIQNTVVKNCSGGQLKRLSIALELSAVRKPNIVFIDEPTTGLDSNGAQAVSQSNIYFNINFNLIRYSGHRMPILSDPQPLVVSHLKHSSAERRLVSDV